MRDLKIKETITGKNTGRSRWLLVLAAGLVILAGVFFYLRRHIGSYEVLKLNPQVTVTADNCYGETLHAVTDRDYEPFSYIREDGSYAGMDVELITEVANRLHMNLDLQLLDWDEAQRRLMTGEADVILNMEIKRVDGDSGMIATMPVDEKEYVVYGPDKVSGIGGLVGKRVGSMQMLSELGLTEEIVYVPTYREMFERLAAGEFDYIVCPLQVGDVFLRQMDLDGIVSSDSIQEMYGCIALREECTELRDRIDTVLRELYRDGTVEQLDSKWIIHYEKLTLSGLIRNHTPFVIAVITGFLLMLFLIAFSLMEEKNLSLEREYTRLLQEKLDTIEQQNMALEEEKRHVEEASRAKSRFLFNMSHDIRTPMHAIIGTAGIARSHLDQPGTVRKYLDDITQAGEGLMTILNSVLEMADLDKNNVRLESMACDLPTLVQTLEKKMQPEAQRKKQELTVCVQELADPVVICDPHRVQQILFHILSNSLKFTQEGGKIRLGLRQLPEGREGAGRYEFLIGDNGPGMSEEFQGRIFELFEREQNSTERGALQGSGLGLSVVKRLTELMNGTIDIQSGLGKGTQSTVVLDFPPAQSRKEEENGGEDVFIGRRVLLADDVEINREIAEMMLETLGCQVVTAVNGEEAVEKYQKAEEPFDLVLLDIQMPVMDGYEAARIIRSMNDIPGEGIPILAVSANSREEDRQRAKEAGMDELIPKPLDLVSFKQTLMQYLIYSAGPSSSAGKRGGDTEKTEK